jgi:NAD(P)-dependent dehydrogenase (short-subunit alcohol dehydrogenase family)
MFDISDKKILITGGSSGIGKALAMGFSKANA